MNCRDISTLLQRTRWWGKAAAVGAFFALGLGANAQSYHIVGSGTGSSGTTTYPNPNTNFYFGARHQFFVTAAQLSASGISTGNSISSVGFNVTGAGAGAGGTLLGWTVKVYTTTSTNPISTAWLTTGLVATSTPTDLSVTSTGWTVTAIPAFTWNGTDNLVVETCFNNTTDAGTRANTQWTNSGLGTGTWSRWYRADDATVCSSTSTTATSTSTRSNIRFGVTLPPCDGEPNAGSITSPVSVCSGLTTVLSATGLSNDDGITYQWEESPNGIDTWDDVADGSGATTSSYTTSAITGTRYFRLKSTCSNSSEENFTNVVTVNADPGQFDEDFSSGSITTNCWSFSGTGTAANLSYNANSAYAAGTGSIMWDFFSQNGGTLIYTSPVISPVGSGMQIEFDVAGRQYSSDLPVDTIYLEESSDGGANWTVIQMMTNEDGGILNTVGVSNTELTAPTSGQWAARAFPLSAGTDRVRFRGVSDFGNNVLVDNIRMTEAPSCQAPTSVAAGSVTNDSAEITWTCVSCTGTFIVEYGTPGFTPGTDGSAGTGTIWTGAPVAGSPVTITGLSPTTSYQVYVREVCPGDDYSPNSSAVSFTTACDALDVPFTENFNSVTTPAFPACWSVENVNGSNTWVTTATPTSFASNAARYPWNGANPADDWLYTPGINLVGGTEYTLSYDYSASGFDEALEVYYGSSANVAGMTELVVDHGVFDDGPFSVTYSITPASSGVYYFGWHAYSDADQFNLEIDNISLIETPACPVPTVVSVSGTTSNGTNVNFTCSGCTGSIIVEYGEAGFTPGTDGTAGVGGTIITGATSPEAISGLDPSTSYDVYVRQDCSVAMDGYSENSTLVNFTTAALPPANDDCGGAIALTVNADFLCGTVTAGTTNAATASVQPDVDSGTPDDDVWFSFVATATTHRVSLLNVSGSVDMGHSVYRALPDPCAAAGMTLVNTSDPDVSNPAGLTIGETYFVRVYRWNTGASNVTFNICIGTPPPPPANDLCANAIPVSCNTVTAGTTVNSTNTGAPATCSGLDINTAGGVWYSVAGFDGPMTVNLSGSSFDTKVAVFTGACGSLVCVDSDDDDGDGTTSLLTWTGSSAQTYLIYVTGYLTQTGTITLALTCGSTNPACTQNGLNLEFQNDGNASEVTWEILNAGNLVVLSGANPIPNNGIGNQALCLPNGCYRLRVLDSGGDGMTTGGYELRTQGTNERIIDNTNNFSTGSVSAISGNQTFCLPIGTDKLIFSSCDKLDWVTNKFIVVAENPAVSAQFGVTNTTSGYEFWFFDPNGSYSFRRFRSHATSDGYGTGALRANHFKINGWTNSVSTPHLPANVLLNVRVRGRVAGNNLEFGPACQFKIDAALAACPRVSLQDNPANTSDFSCGVFRNFGGVSNAQNRIYANPPQPVPTVASSSVRYQFRFRIPGEGVCIVRPPQTSALMVLNWSAASGPQLQCSKTYEVDVRVSLNGGATWCFGPAGSSQAAACADTEDWGKVCNVTINPCALPNGGGNSMVVEGNSTFTMFPNPNRGDQLFLSVSSVEEGVNTVSVDIFDLTGKRVMARTIAVQDGFINTNLELNGDLAGGLYVVNVTAGTKAYTERLVIQP